MRMAAIVAGVSQLLLGLLAAVPQIFGIEAFSDNGQFGFRIFESVSSLVLALFFLGIVATPSPNLRGGVKIVSLVAALALALENRALAYNSFRGAVAAAESAQWRYHPARQLAYESASTIPAFAVITLIAFLLVLFAKSLRAPNWDPSGRDQTGFLRLASLSAAAVTGIGLAGALFSIILAHGSLSHLVIPVSLRLAALISLAGFFLVFGLNQSTKEQIIGNE